MHPTTAAYLGLSRGPEGPDGSEGQPEDHVILGTATGEVVVCDVTRQGLVVLRFPVFK